MSNRARKKGGSEEFGRDGKFYFCPYCEYKSESQRSLKRHVNGMHTHEVTYVCHQCGEVKYRKDDLRRHIARVHEGVPADRYESGAMYSEATFRDPCKA